MNIKDQPLQRRQFLRGALATAVVIPLGGLLASCAGGGSSGTPSSGGGTKSATNPFGIKKGSSIDAVIFNGGFGYDYVTFASKIVDTKWGVTSKVTPATNIAQSLQPRFVGGDPPDLIDNSGANLIGFKTIVNQLETMDDLLASNNYEGQKISDTLYPNVSKPGTFSGKFVGLNYAIYNYGLWYSASLFKENGWVPPQTWDEALDLGAKAKAKGKYLFVWGKEAATYYLIMMMSSAIKEGGLGVLDDLENLKPKAWSNPAIQSVFAKMEEIVSRGYFIPGGAGTQFTAAQAKWSLDQQAIMYATGGWIESEMQKATKAGFDMAVSPTPTVTTASKLPFTAIRSAAQETYIVPSQGKNVAGGMEMLRAMLSKEAAVNFSKTRMVSTIVKGLVPADGFGHPGLSSQSKMLAAAGSNTFYTTFISVNGLNTAQLVVLNGFLSGQINAAGMTQQLQTISDGVAGK